MENKDRSVLEKAVSVISTGLSSVGNGLIKYSPKIVATASMVFMFHSLNYSGQGEEFPYVSGAPVLGILGLTGSQILDKVISKRYDREPL